MTQVIIAEKPSAARKLESALKGQRDVIVVPAVGHLFGLKGIKRGYPVFDVEWKPTFEISKSSAFSKKYFLAMKKLVKKADELIVATDYDIEGEVIGLNIVRSLFGKKDAERMKFSTLTAHDLQKAYFNRSKTLDWGQANAGEARHHLDWFYGINLSKAVMSALSKATNSFQKLSIGRVQGPALALLAKRELQIRAFVSKPYWNIFANFKFGQAIHKEKQFWEQKKAKQIFEKVRDQHGTVSKIEKSLQQILPPVPFDLTSLQMEAWRVFRISPKATLVLAQKLYTAAYISYPRTSSQRLPPQIGYKKILNALSRNSNYTKLAKYVLTTSLKPRQGGKIDPAHPAIYPTGELPKKLDPDEFRIYDLIVKRFFAVFGHAGERELTNLEFIIEDEPFVMNLSRTTKNGWLDLYAPYLRYKDVKIPSLLVGKAYAQKTTIEQKETEPPARYTQASIIKELEKRNLGTKATRANIIDILYQRGYVFGAPIQVSDLGLTIVDTFEKYSPQIVSEELTRNFELDLEKIRANKIKKETVLDRAKKIVTQLTTEIDLHKEKIGKELSKALEKTREAERKKNTLMKCQKCNKGDLRVLYSRRVRKRFLACSGYPDCKTTFSLPQKGNLTMLKKKCEKCGANLIKVKAARKRAWELCINCGVMIENKQE